MTSGDPLSVPEMRILVTGGGGFLGGGIVRRLAGLGHRVRSFSRRHYPRLTENGVEQVCGDLADREAVERACRNCALVFHVAARAGVWGRYRDFYNTNVLGTRNVLAACLREQIPWLVYTSSPSVVFHGKDMEGVDESVSYPKQYEAPYPETKAIAEREVLSGCGPRLAGVVLRPHLIWGPEDTHIVPGIVERRRRGQLKRIGRGNKLVDFTYIDNAVEAHILAADALLKGRDIVGKSYFITDDRPVPLWDFIDQLLAAAGLPAVRGRVPAGVACLSGFLLENVYRLLRVQKEPRLTRFLARELSTAHWFDISAAKRDLGYRATVSIETGLERLRDWFQGQNRKEP